MNKSKSAHPLLTLGEKDKFYLALTRVNDATMSYIHALLLKKNRAGAYLMNPRFEVMAFDSRDKATTYCCTLEQIMLYQHNTMPHIVEAFEKEIAKFYEHTK